MNSKSYSLKIPGILFIVFIIVSRIDVTAQSGLTFYTDAARNCVSGGLYARSALLGQYNFGKYQLKSGLQSNLINGNNIFLSGFRVEGAREFKIKNTLLELSGFRLWTAYSEIMQEINYACVFTIIGKHFDIQIGTNFRTYSLRRNTSENSYNGNDAKIHENFNIMYSFGYNLKPSYCRWNAGVTLTNVDYFLINQETNPYVNLKGYYKVSSPLCLFAEVWYKNAGVTNISSNYFGFVIRGGVQWNFN